MSNRSPISYLSWRFFLCLAFLCAGPVAGRAEAPWRDDAGAALQQGWQAFSAQQYATAARLYQTAILLGEPSGDAELGLGWSLQRLGRCESARAHFATVLRLRPEDAGARLGLSLCPPPRPLRLLPELAQGLYVYANHPTRDLASATTLRLAAWLHEHWLLSGAYRFLYLSGRTAADTAWQQHEVYAAAGYATPEFGLSLHYAAQHGALVAATDYGDYAETAHHLGFDVRVSPWGDGLLALAASLFHDGPTVRGELGWRLPIWRGLSVRPAAVLQWSSEGFRPSGSLSLRYDHARFGLFAGGKYGNERRPAYLSYELIYNGPELIPYGAWAGAWGRARGFVLSLSYALDHLVRDRDASGAALSADAVTTSDVHYLTLSLTKEL